MGLPPHHLAVGFHPQRFSGVGTDGKPHHPTVFPSKVFYLESPSGHQTFHFPPGFPRVGQGRQQVDVALMALHKHLGYAGRAAEVAVDLERWVGIKEIAVGASFLLVGAVSDEAVIGE